MDHPDYSQPPSQAEIDAAWKQYFADELASNLADWKKEEMQTMRQVGDIVQLANITHDEFDRPVETPPTPFKIVRVNEAPIPRSFDYEIAAPNDGNHFYVYEYEIEDFLGV